MHISVHFVLCTLLVHPLHLCPFFYSVWYICAQFSKCPFAFKDDAQFCYPNEEQRSTWFILG